jgi:hypothetical protein
MVAPSPILYAPSSFNSFLNGGYESQLINQRGGEKMKKKILGIFVTVLALAMFAVPVMAKQEGTPVTYYDYWGPLGFLEQTYDKIHVSGTGSDSAVEHSHSSQSIVKSYLESEIYADEGLTELLFYSVRHGKVTTDSRTLQQIWHFRYVWTCADDPESGFKGSLNGKGVYQGMGMGFDFSLSGVFNGFGEYKGQKILMQYSTAEGHTGILVS